MAELVHKCFCKTIIEYRLFVPPRRAPDALIDKTALHDLGAKVRAYDPIGMEQAKKVLPELTYCEDAYQCAKGAAALVIVTEWEEFRALDLDQLKTVMNERPAVVDLRNIYPPGDLEQRGFVYESIGRPSRK